MKQQIENIFANLDHWRHLPNYQLERRTDIFFSIYLKALIEEYEQCELLDIIIPELPIKTDGSGRSFKVDYVLFSKDRNIAYFVELKTDDDSRRDGQDEYLRTAASAGLRKVLTDLKEIVARTNSYRKYWHLMRWLAKAEVIKLPIGIRDFLYPAIRSGLRRQFAAAEVVDKEVQIRVVYIQPCKKQASAEKQAERCIDFDDIRKFLQKYDDEFSKTFATYLSLWKARAGDREPTL